MKLNVAITVYRMFKKFIMHNICYLIYSINCMQEFPAVIPGELMVQNLIKAQVMKEMNRKRTTKPVSQLEYTYVSLLGRHLGVLFKVDTKLCGAAGDGQVAVAENKLK
jgi:hypothetical protein